MMLVHPFRPRVAAGWLEVSAIDVGQAESLFVGLPDGRTMLVDGGGIPSWKGRVSSLDTGEDVVAPYRHSRSIRSLDIIVSTHGHGDHIGGLHYLLKAFRPREVWTGIASTDPDSTALRTQARRLGIRVVNLSAGMLRGLGDVSVQVLAPLPAARVSQEAHNDDTVVLRLTYGAHSFLLTGDMEESLERRLLPDLTRTTVLKVAHHGSKTSTSPDLLAVTRPAFALISAGEGNSYRLPHQSVVRRMTRARVAVFRTDRNGLSSIRTDGTILATGSMR
jgi:competence protein ComEC